MLSIRSIASSRNNDVRLEVMGVSIDVHSFVKDVHILTIGKATRRVWQRWIGKKR